MCSKTVPPKPVILSQRCPSIQLNYRLFKLTSFFIYLTYSKYNVYLPHELISPPSTKIVAMVKLSGRTNSWPVDIDPHSVAGDYLL